MRFTLIVSLVLSLLAVLFALQNPELILIQLGPFEVEGSAALVLIITFMLGVFVGILAMIPSRLKSRKKVQALKKQAPEAPPITPAETPPTDVPDAAESRPRH